MQLVERERLEGKFNSQRVNQQGDTILAGAFNGQQQIMESKIPTAAEY